MTSDHAADLHKIYTNLEAIPFSRPIGKEYLDGYRETKDVYKFRMTEHLRNLLDRADNEGLRKQFLPSVSELVYADAEYMDVYDEQHNEPVRGIVHLYPTKVLLQLTINCPSYCRFCFRKEKLNDATYGKFLSPAEVDAALGYITEHQIEEVIFSGGDPLFCSDHLLKSVMERLGRIPTVRMVRFHTRYFTFDPDRVTEDFIRIAKSSPAAFIVAHMNQVEELTPEAKRAIARCVDGGIPVYSQSALLRGVNDNEEALSSLFTELIYSRVKPYYLFHTDPVRGLEQFRVRLSRGIELYKNIYNRISGLAMPIYLFNIPGGFGHVILDLGNVREIAKGQYELTNWKGEMLVYRDYEPGEDESE